MPCERLELSICELRGAVSIMETPCSVPKFGGSWEGLAIGNWKVTLVSCKVFEIRNVVTGKHSIKGGGIERVRMLQVHSNRTT